MREWAAGLLLSRTGADVATWNQRVAEAGATDERALREWLAGQGVTGYAQALVVWERFGYPEFLNADAEELVAGQYADRPRLRRILDAVLAILPELGTVTVQARKTYISLVGPRRTFAVVQATTKNRVDLGLRLDGAEPGGRLEAAKNVGNGVFTVRVALTEPGDVDKQVRGWLRLAYDENAAPPATRRPARRAAPPERPRRAHRQRQGPPSPHPARHGEAGHRTGARRRHHGTLGVPGDRQAGRRRFRLRRPVRPRRPHRPPLRPGLG
jgi:hypothetical protein